MKNCCKKTREDFRTKIVEIIEEATRNPNEYDIAFGALWTLGKVKSKIKKLK